MRSAAPRAIIARPITFAGDLKVNVHIQLSPRLRARRRSDEVAERPLVPACGHDRHIGTCPVCQQHQLARWEAQLCAVSRTSPAAARQN
jgi:hypothetical protein